jgi:Rps23 Pro-64 3,4-dihydroxylase Tpa1-like proline 4-hydroxylase
MLNESVSRKYLSDNFARYNYMAFQRNKPFPCLILDNFFDKLELGAVFQELLKENFQRKEADLFSFYQTQDFEDSENTTLQNLRRFLMSDEFVYLIEEITGLKLKTGKISISGTLYEDGDYLLCHDDQLEGRKIAFMIYLSDLQMKNGGSLDLFYSIKGKPMKVMRSIQPKFNRFVIFEVSPHSFHQVSEVIGKQRFAIGGWLYKR